DGNYVAVGTSSGNLSVYYSFSNDYLSRTEMIGYVNGIAQHSTPGAELALSSPASPFVLYSGLTFPDNAYLHSAFGTDNAFPIVVNSYSTTTPTPMLLGGRAFYGAGGMTGIYESFDLGD